MRRQSPTQLPMPFDRHLPAVVLPAAVAQAVVTALADLLLATATQADDDEERHDAREDQR